MAKLAPRHRLARTSVVDRDAALIELCRDRRVLDLACAAWPATERWCQDQSLLHMRLRRVCRDLAGFDICPAAIEIMRRHGIDNLYEVDLLDAEAVSEAWGRLTFQPDIVLAGELIEHLDNPGQLLRNCRAHMQQASRFMITVPNAFSVTNWLHVLSGYEKVAADHVAYYSETNLKELATRGGFELDSIRWYRYSNHNSWGHRIVALATKPLLFLRPQLADGLIAEYRPVSPT